MSPEENEAIRFGCQHSEGTMMARASVLKLRPRDEIAAAIYRVSICERPSGSGCTWQNPGGNLPC